jgi:hypothetical protein
LVCSLRSFKRRIQNQRCRQAVNSERLSFPDSPFPFEEFRYRKELNAETERS